MNRILIRFILPYIIILLISLITGIVVHNKTFLVLQDEVEKSNIGLLEQGMNIVDKRIEEVDSLVWRIANDSGIVRMQQIQDPYAKHNLYRMVEIQNRLQDYSVHNNFISDYYIFFKNNNMVINNSLIEENSNIHRYFSFENEEPDFYKELGNAFHYRSVFPAEDVLIRGKKASVLPYIHSLGLPNKVAGTIFMLISNEQVNKLFQGLDISGGGWAYIADPQGNILGYASDIAMEGVPQPIELTDERGVMNRKMGSKEMMVTYVTSNYNGWVYAAVQPTHIVMDKINYIQKITLFIFISILSVGLLIAFYLAYRNSKPIRKLLQTVSSFTAASTDRSRDSFIMIQNTVSRIVENHAELSEKLEQQLPFVRAAFFDRLIKGRFQSNNDIKTLMNHVRVEFTGNYYVAVIFYFSEDGAIDLDEQVLQQLEKNKWFIKEVVTKLIEDNYYFHDIEDDKVAILFSYPYANIDKAAEATYAYVTAIQQQIHDIHQITSVCSIGNIYTSLLDVSISFAEAEQALVQARENQIIWYRDIDHNNESYFYPENIEMRIMNFVKTGNPKQLDVVLQELYHINFVEKSLPVYLLKLLLFDMWGSLAKISEQIDLKEKKPQNLLSAAIHMMDSKENVELNYQHVNQSFMQICLLVEEKRVDRKSILLNQIISFIDEHYTSPDLSLTTLSEKFGLTEAYFSRFFKDEKGITYLEYLEGKRLEQIKKLLVETDISISDIAQSVGYNSLNTFGRAFKRSTGISAMTFRQLEKIQA